MKQQKNQDSIYRDLIEDMLSNGFFDKGKNWKALFDDETVPFSVPTIGAAGIASSIPTMLLQKALSKQNRTPAMTLVEYMDKMIDSMPDTNAEIRENVKARYHKLLNSDEFILVEADKVKSKNQFLTEYLPKRIACIFCYTFTFENYDKSSFEYITGYVETEYQKIKPDIQSIKTHSEMIAFLSNHCIEKDIFIVCTKASVQMKVDKERMKVDFQYITVLVYHSMYDSSKNAYVEDVALPAYSEESFEEDAKMLLPEGFFLDSGKPARPNTLCKKLKESDSVYVEKEIRLSQYITFSKLSEELEQQLNSGSEDEYIVKETILNRMTILMDLVGYHERTIPKSMQGEFIEIYQMFSKDFLLRIKKYNEKGCIDYQADKENNEILQIIHRDTETCAIYRLCRLIEIICLINCTSFEDYQKQVATLNLHDKHIRAICCYYQELNR